MFGLDPIFFGAIMVLASLGITGILLALLRVLPQLRSYNHPPTHPPTSLGLPSNDEAVFLVQTGGKVIYTNQTAREWFGSPDGVPNLERLARRTSPNDVFWHLCASEARARFSLDGRIIEGISHYLPGHNGNGNDGILVTLHRPQVAPMKWGEEESSGQALDIFAELSRSMAASLDLEATLQAILESVERLISLDFAEITIWDSDNRQLIPYHFVGTIGIDRRLERARQVYRENEGYSGYLASMRKPLFIPNVEAFREIKPVVDRKQYPFNAYLGIPLLIAGDLVGTLELASLSCNAFDQNDLEVLRILSGQAAVALQNALHFQVEQRRVMELSGLAQLAQAASSIQDGQELFSRLIEAISPLISAEILGFLVYDDTRRILRACNPFIGIPANIVNIYQTRIAPDSPAERLWLSQEMIVAPQAQEDERLEVLGLRFIAQAASIQYTVLAPLSTGGRMLGYLQVGDKPGGANFDQQDIRLLTIIARQSAGIIENAELVRISQERAQRAEALRRIADLTRSQASLDEILTFSLREIARLLCADFGVIYLVDENHDELRLHQPSLFSLVGDETNRINHFQLKAIPYQDSITATQQAFSSGNVPLDESLSPVYQATTTHFQLKSILLVPVVVGGRGIGEILLGNRAEDFFDQSDLTLVCTIASQLASAVEKSLLVTQTDESLRRRVGQLQALARASREFNTTQDQKRLLELVQQEFLHITQAKCGAILYLDPTTNDHNELRFVSMTCAHDVEPREVDRHVLRTREVLTVNDYQKPVPALDGTTLDPPHVGVQASLIVPLIYQDLLVGLIHLHAGLAGHFDQSTVETANNLAVQTAIAIANIQRYQKQVSLASENYSSTQQLEQSVKSIEAELEQTRERLKTAQAQIPAILEKENEKSLLIRSLNQQVNWLLVGLGLPRALQGEPDKASVLRTFTQELLVHLNMRAGMTVESVDGNPRLLNVLGAVPESEVNLETLLGQRNPLRACLQTGSIIIVPNLTEDAEWKNSQLLQVLEAGGFICFPIRVRNMVAAAVLLVSYIEMNALTTDEIRVLDLITQQASLALDNLELIHTTNRGLMEVNLLLAFSRQLGALDPKGILHRLVETALDVVAGAQAGMVALWQPEFERLVPSAALGYIHNERMLEINYRKGQALPGRVFADGQALRVDEVIFTRDYDLDSTDLLRYRDATEGRLPISSLILPLQTAENRMGVFVLDNFKETAAFTPEDQDLIGSLTRQTALTLENTRLVQAAEQRATQLQSLANVSATITSSLEPEALIRSLLEELHSVIPYETGTLWLRQGNQLTIRAASGFEDSEERVGLSVAVQDSQLLRDMINTSQLIYVGDVRTDERFPALVEPRYLSWLGVPLLTKGEVLGVIALEKQEINSYTPEQLQLINTFASQAAVALENARLYQESLRRASELDERSQRLALLNRLSTELSMSLDLNYIVNVGIRELKQAVPCSRVAAVLIERDDQPYLYAEAPEILESYPDTFPASPLVDRIRESLGIFSTEDVQAEKILSTLDDFFKKRATRGLLALPLVTGETLNGILLVQSGELYRYPIDEVELARTISNQVAVALQNARLFSETERLIGETRARSSILGALFDMGVSMTQYLDQVKLIKLALENVTRLMQADSAALAYLLDTETMQVHMLDRGEWIEPLQIPLDGTSLSEYVLDTGKPFHIRDMETERVELPVAGVTKGEPARCWLGVPLIVRGVVIGAFSMQAYRPNAFSLDDQQLLEQIGNQVAVTLDNARLFETVQDYASDLEKRVMDRTQDVEIEHHRTQTLLNIITELSNSLDLDIVLNRTLAVVNETLGSEHSLIMLTRPEDGLLYLRASLGYASDLPKGGQLAGIKPSEGLSGWVLRNKQSVLIPDVIDDPRWVSRGDYPDQHRSAMAVPLTVGEECLGVLMLYHRLPEQFHFDQLDLVEATAKQIAVAINNAQLYSLIRDQAERLGDMLRTQHVETSRSQAILEAVADGVLVTDANREITLFNSPAEQILGLARRDVVGKSLERFLGLFGKAARSWVQTIRTWSEDPASYNRGDIYSEQIDLDDGRVVSVHLSPVLLRNDFLGTVSIFRDITPLIEVDRLKSEFVATVSHELRTPMTSIKGYVEIMLMGASGELNLQQTRFLEIVKQNTERLAILVNDLLDISRIEAGRVTLSLQPLDLPQLVDECLGTMSERMMQEDRQMEIVRDYADEIPSAYGDRGRVRQIVDNLLENAYQYTPPGGRIEVAVYPVGSEVQIDVRDNGIGIPLADQARIFERFFRGEDPLVLATSGTGLGLSIVKHLVMMHKGRIWFHSTGRPGDGSEFSVTLPMYMEEYNNEN
jgi:PAS domain S-box-containing protein